MLPQPSTILRWLSKQRSTRILSSSKQLIIFPDTVYWGHNFGVVAFKDWYSEYKQYIRKT
jgi:hypothetical protein